MCWDLFENGQTPPYPRCLSCAGDSTGLGLSGGQAAGDAEEQGLIRTGAGQVEVYATRVASEHRSDLQELQTDRAALSPGQYRTFQAQPADGFQQQIRQTRQQ